METKSRLRAQESILLTEIIKELASEKCGRSIAWITQKLNGLSSFKRVAAGAAEPELPDHSIFSRLMDNIQSKAEDEEEALMRIALNKAVDHGLIATEDGGRTYRSTDEGMSWARKAYSRVGWTVLDMQDAIVMASLVCIVLARASRGLSPADLFSSLIDLSDVESQELHDKLENLDKPGLDKGLNAATSKGWIQLLDGRFFLTDLGRSEGVCYFSSEKSAQ